MSDLEHLSVVIPTYNEPYEVLDVLRIGLEALGAEVIIVDDGSNKPYPMAQIKHSKNLGYGQALMSGIELAKHPTVLTLDGDGQHTVRDVLNLFSVYKMLNVDMIIGSRRLDHESSVRMWGRKFLNLIASFFTGIYMQDLNSGMRIFSRDKAIGYFPILCKKFSFTTSLTLSYMCDNFKVEWFPIKVFERTKGSSNVNVIRDGITTLKYILWIGIALRTRRIRSWLRSLR